MKCPHCHSDEKNMVTRSLPGELGTHRRRKCCQCQREFATVEMTRQTLETVSAQRLAAEAMAIVKDLP